MTLGITISGYDVTEMVMDSNSVQLTRNLQNRGTLKFRLRDDTRAYHPEPGEPVYVTWSSTTIFGGPIESVDEERPSTKSTSPNILTIQAVDWSRLLDRFFVANSFESKTVEEIVTSIIYDETPLASDHGVTIGTIDSFSVTKANFRYQKASDCLRDLCQLAGFSWSISPTKVIDIRDRATYAAPFTIGEGAGGLSTYRKLTLQRNLREYRNAQWIIAGREQTEERTEYFHGDTTTADPEKRGRTFNTAFPVASITWIKRNTTAQRVGVRGVDTDGDLTLTDPGGTAVWKQWFYAVDSTEISQNNAEDEVNNPTLEPNQTLEVKYTGFYPIVDYEKDAAEITARSLEEGGSGIYEWLEEDSKCDTLALAQEKANRLIEQFGRIPRTLKYEVDTYGLLPGHLQDITLTAHDINAEYMVDQVQYTFPTPEIIRCSVTAYDGERQGGWIDYWRKAAMSGRTFSIRENEVVALAEDMSETLSTFDVLDDSINGSATLADYNKDPYTCGLIGVTTTVGGEEFPLTRFGRSRIGEARVP